MVEVERIALRIVLESRGRPRSTGGSPVEPADEGRLPSRPSHELWPSPHASQRVRAHIPPAPAGRHAVSGRRRRNPLPSLRSPRSEAREVQIAAAAAEEGGFMEIVEGISAARTKFRGGIRHRNNEKEVEKEGN